MNVQGIVKKYLEANGYDGLLNHDNPCGCLKDDLATCNGFLGNDGIPLGCLPGYKRKATEEEIDDCGDWVICEEKPKETEILEALKQAQSDLDNFNPDGLSDGIMGKIKNAIKLAQGEWIMKTPIKDQYENIESTVNNAIRKAIKEDKCGTVNRGDLKCTEILWCVPKPGIDAPFWQVTIDEASPDDPTLQAFVSEYCSKNGIENIVINTEW